MLRRIPKVLLLVALLAAFAASIGPAFGRTYMQVLPLGRQTTSASGRVSFRPKSFPVRQYELPGNLQLIFSNRMGPRVRSPGIHHGC
jgi:hypothetical protein